MKLLPILFFLVCWNFVSSGQSLSKKDSSALVSAVEAFADCSKKPDFSDFKNISAEEIYVIWDSSFILNQKEFFEKYFVNLNELDDWKEWESGYNRLSFVVQNDNETTDVTVAFVPDSVDDYWEAENRYYFTLNFRRSGGGFIFTGMEYSP